MKIVFEGDSLSDIHAQICETAASIVGNGPVNTEVASHIEAQNFTSKPAPKFETNHATQEGSRIDGHVVSVGKVWTPHESGGHVGVPVEQYQAEKEIAAGGDLDSDGLPWDARIHSSNKEKSKDGKWRKRRGMNDKAFIAQVEAELRAKLPSGGATAVSANPQVQATNNVKPFGSMTQEQYQQHIAPPAMPTTAQRVDMPQGPSNVTPLPQFGTPPAQANGTGAYDFASFRAQLLNILGNLVNSGKLPPNWIQDNRNQFGGAEVWEWSNNEQGSLALFNYLVQQGLIQKVGN